MYRILTHPPIHNYGGILQAFALQQVLNKIGIQSRVIDFFSKKWGSELSKCGIRAKCSCIKNLLKIIFLGTPLNLPGLLYPNLFRLFKQRFMCLWRLDLNRKKIFKLTDNHPFVVGSDQVWRCSYARNIESVPFFFLNFATPDQRKRSIAYAASFGTDEWEGTPQETEDCAKLLKQFKAVSVREHNGVDICRDVFGIEAVQMPDPTLLLEVNDYNYLIRHWYTKSISKPFIAVYLLDQTEKTTALIEEVSRVFGYNAQSLIYKPGARRLMDRLPLSIPQWLRCIRDSEFVITDSFHGCVFAIIFNKPFVCLGNEKRGSARFDSLLGTFGLQDRLVTNLESDTILQILKTPIDWERVNAIRHSEQARAFDFLRKNLD